MKYNLISKYRSELMGFAMLIILVFHAFDLTIGIPAFDFLRIYLFIGVDMFVFLSGLGISMSLTKRECEYTCYMKRRFSRILPSYYIVVIPWTVFYALVHGGHFSSLLWNTTLLAYWVKPAGAFNWYVTGIMLFYAIAPFWHKAISKHKHPALPTLAATVLSVGVALLLMKEGYWYYLDIIYRLPIFFIGMLVGLYISKDKKLGAKELIASAVSLVVGIALFAASVKGIGMIVPCFSYILLVFPILLLLSAAFEYIPLGAVRALLRPIGNASLEIYLLNASIFIETELLRKVITFGGPSNRLYYLIIFTVNILLGIGFSKLMAHLRGRISKAR